MLDKQKRAVKKIQEVTIHEDVWNGVTIDGEFFEYFNLHRFVCEGNSFESANLFRIVTSNNYDISEHPVVAENNIRIKKYPNMMADGRLEFSLYKEDFEKLMVAWIEIYKNKNKNNMETNSNNTNGAQNITDILKKTKDFANNFKGIIEDAKNIPDNLNKVKDFANNFKGILEDIKINAAKAIYELGTDCSDEAIYQEPKKELEESKCDISLKIEQILKNNLESRKTVEERVLKAIRNGKEPHKGDLDNIYALNAVISVLEGLTR